VIFVSIFIVLFAAHGVFMNNRGALMLCFSLGMINTGYVYHDALGEMHLTISLPMFSLEQTPDSWIKSASHSDAWVMLLNALGSWLASSFAFMYSESLQDLRREDEEAHQPKVIKKVISVTPSVELVTKGDGGDDKKTSIDELELGAAPANE